MKLEGLNPAQKEAVLKTDGPLMVLAGAGSGKTKTLVTKISYLIEEKGISPYQVLALTFSNKAAKEMRERVSTHVNADIGALQVTTFHAFCAKLLRSEAKYIGLSRNFTIYDTSESKAVAKSILSRHGVSLKEVSPFEVLYFIDDIKNQGHYVGREQDDYEIDEDDIFYKYYLEYEDELHRANALDFGGLITAVVQLFEQHPEVLQRYQDRFKYILVDEYQDTNRAQFRLIKMLSEKTKNICVVGDEDQSIYSWRGADIRNILDFEEEFPDVSLIKLEQNYRSSRNIIEAATHVISRNTQRKGKKMWTDNPDGDNIKIIECTSDREEAEFISKEIMKLKDSGVKNSDISVFYRTNSQSRILEDNLRRAMISYRIVGGIKFYERKEVKDLLAYLKVVINEKDSLSLSRIINVPTRGIGATTLRKLEAEAIKSQTSLWEAISSVIENPTEYKHIRLSAKVKSSLNNFVSLISELRVLDKNKELPSVIYEKALYDSGYWEFLRASKDYESQARMENLEELGNAIKQFEQIENSPTLASFLETITLDSQTNEQTLEEESAGEVSLMTVHGAKGLEFNYVFVAGAEENVFPSYRSLDEGETALEEERRLFYVAMTRAMEKLYITFAQGRMLFGQIQYNGPSRFLIEIPNKFYEWIKTHKSKQNNEFGDTEFDDFEASQEVEYDDEPVIYTRQEERSISANSSKAKFPKGVQIVHSLYGEGTVLETDGFGNDEKVVVKFRDGARKKFMVKFAPLTRI